MDDYCPEVRACITELSRAFIDGRKPDVLRNII